MLGIQVLAIIKVLSDRNDDDEFCFRFLVGLTKAVH